MTLGLYAAGREGNKKAGEYSEEDTHRPVRHYRKVVADRTFGKTAGQSAIVSQQKETRWTLEGSTTGHNYLNICVANLYRGSI